MSGPTPLRIPDEGSTTNDIHQQLRGLILSGQLGAGERLPTVRQTAADLGVATGTVAKAYKLLEAEGFVVTRTAAGTRVAESAGVLPETVTRRIRALIEDATTVGVELDDIVSVLRLTWPAASAD